MPENPAHVSCSIVNLQQTKDYFIAQCRRVETICENLSHNKPALIKLDVEGAEYQIIQDLIASNYLPRLLMVEFDEIHTPLDSDAFNRIDNTIDLLEKHGMQCIYMDGANLTFIKVR